MEKSLLDLLRAEDVACGKVMSCQRTIDAFQKELNRVEQFYSKYAEDEEKRKVALQLKMEDSESANRIIARETEKMEQSQRELESVRSEIRDYFAMLFA